MVGTTVASFLRFAILESIFTLLRFAVVARHLQPAARFYLSVVEGCEFRPIASSFGAYGGYLRNVPSGQIRSSEIRFVVFFFRNFCPSLTRIAKYRTRSDGETVRAARTCDFFRIDISLSEKLRGRIVGAASASSRRANPPPRRQRMVGETAAGSFA